METQRHKVHITNPLNTVYVGENPQKEKEPDQSKYVLQCEHFRQREAQGSSNKAPKKEQFT